MYTKIKSKETNTMGAGGGGGKGRGEAGGGGGGGVNAQICLVYIGVHQIKYIDRHQIYFFIFL